jgi:hypothetical protein
MANGIESKLFNNTIETSFREPDLVACFAASITLLSVSCANERTVEVIYHARTKGYNNNNKAFNPK